MAVLLVLLNMEWDPVIFGLMKSIVLVQRIPLSIVERTIGETMIVAIVRMLEFNAVWLEVRAKLLIIKDIFIYIFHLNLI